MYANSKLVNGSTCTRLVHDIVCFLPPVPCPPPSLPLYISCSPLQADWAIDFIHLSLEVGLPEQAMGLGLGLVVEDKPFHVHVHQEHHTKFKYTCTSTFCTGIHLFWPGVHEYMYV